MPKTCKYAILEQLVMRPFVLPNITRVAQWSGAHMCSTPTIAAAKIKAIVEITFRSTIISIRHILLLQLRISYAPNP